LRKNEATVLSVIIPCYNEEATLQSCLTRVRQLQGDDLALEVIIVDDCSTDKSLLIAKQLAAKYSNVSLLCHSVNLGKGAALRTGFQAATGDYVAVQDADLEYNPLELRELLAPLHDGRADVVYGSRFMGGRPHRVLYFWHSLGNSFLTFLSNMFTDLNLTDMETCYKVFKREIIQSIQIQENRFGFEPEITAKIAQKKLRIYEMGISYCGRTYEEGKKIGWRDGVRALYCIIRYNAYQLPLPMQFLVYLLIGGGAAVVNMLMFLGLWKAGLAVGASALIAFGVAAVVNYLLCIFLLFRHKARWNTFGEIFIYLLVVMCGGLIDMQLTRTFFDLGTTAWFAKAIATLVCLLFNFLGRRWLVFPESALSN